jgi:benzil reductase ((S)-benzoin forming)
MFMEAAVNTRLCPTRLVVLTGSSRGIGAALVTEIEGPGTTLILPTRGDQAEGMHITVPLDLSMGAASGAVVAQAVADRSADEIWFFDVAAVLPLHRVIYDGFPEAWRDAMQINVAAPLAIGSALLQRARLAGSRFRAVHLTSGAATRPITGWGAYGMTKAAAALGWATLAAEEPDTAVAIIDPGAVDTGMQVALRKACDPAAAPIERLLTPGDAACRILEQAGWYG